MIAVDLPGFGGSPPLDGEPSPAALAAAVADGLERIGVRDYDVAGNSLGGWVALELALAGHARSVVAIGPAGLWSGPLAPKRTVARTLGAARAPARRAADAQPGAAAARAGDVRRTPRARPARTSPRG